MCVVDKMTAPSNAASFCKENCTAISFKTTVSFSRLISAELRAIAKDALDGIRDSYEAAMEASSRVDPATVKLLNE
uniref:Uncharacterized protein n=1 Tax=Plectus sambesii TaxID=2011161 RepID=A0A914VD71_9BILA